MLAADKEDAMSKFFTYENRLHLQKGLKDSLSIKAIAASLNKNSTTVSREIKKYSSEVATGYPGYPFNECKNRFNCRKKNICGKECTRKSVLYCKICPGCNEHCPEFIQEICIARFRSPYVCNSYDKGCRIGRNYQEYQKFKEKNPDLAEVQMDSVIGVKGGKCLLTIHFVESSLMLAFQS